MILNRIIILRKRLNFFSMTMASIVQCNSCLLLFKLDHCTTLFLLKKIVIIMMI